MIAGKYLGLIFVILFLFYALSEKGLAGKIAEADESIVSAGIEKAKEMGFNPIPVYTDEKGKIIIVPGTLFSIRNGQWSLVNGDMLINVGNHPVPAEKITLNKGEYAVVQNGKIEKQSGSLVSGSENEISEMAHDANFQGKDVTDKDSLVLFKGKITNLIDAKKYLNKESYLQLLSVPQDGGVPFETDMHGRTVYTSDLPSIDIPVDGNFSLKVKVSDLKQGKYVIVGQKLNPYGLGSGVTPILSLESSKKLIIIEHPKDTKNKRLLDFGDVIIPIPKN
jgi:hypothetical protein